MPSRSTHPSSTPAVTKKTAGTEQADPLAATAARIKSIVRNTLLASPDFPRLYADVVLSSAPNSPEAKLLAPHYKKIIGRTTGRTFMSNVHSCTHIKVNGVRCGSPALRGEQFCYFHQRMIRHVRYPDSRLHHVALLEDEEAIQASLMEVVNGLIRGTIEVKRGELILRALNTAVRNIRRVYFGLHKDEMVREVPNYDERPTNRTTTAATVFSESLPRTSPERSRATPDEPAAAVRSAVTPPSAARRVDANQPQTLSHPSRLSKNRNSVPNSSERKPPASAKEASAPKERSATVYPASSG
jgi:hypothetical protein